MVSLDAFPVSEDIHQTGYRLIHSKYPPIALFDDVATADEFEALYEIQAMTNPRLKNEVGNLNLLPKEDIPFDIDGTAYAVAPFTHVNPDGSRFSDGSYGCLYIGNTIDTAISEVRYHQQQYWSKVNNLAYERFVFRGLCCEFSSLGCITLSANEASAPLLDPHDYQASRAFGAQCRRQKINGIIYPSVRHQGGVCYGLLTPKNVSRIYQSAHYEMIFDKGILAVNKIMGHS